MKYINREQYNKLGQELIREKRMVFLAGARQSGKTTLAKNIAKTFKNSLYFNWDILSDKRKIIDDPVFFQNMNRLDDSRPLVILDELHKYKNWKNYLKGIYDGFFSDYNFFVSGSGRLDTYQKGGDSLAGRYLLFHLFPFTVSELGENKQEWNKFKKDPLRNFLLNDPSKTAAIWKRLSELSGFPEPFSRDKKLFWTRWSPAYHKQIIREDIRDMAAIKNIQGMELLFSLLPSKVGSPLSINGLAGDIGVSFDTVKNWLSLLEISFLAFRISPWTKRITRAIKKEQKLYLLDHPLISDAGNRFENMVALELYRTIFLWNEQGRGNFKLHYIRDKEGREADFLISDNNIPFLILEAKNSSENLSKPLVNFQEYLNIPAVQLVNQDNIYKFSKKGNSYLLTVTAHQWLSSLP
jgi:predicted AAA+ superfamily ATPase